MIHQHPDNLGVFVAIWENRLCCRCRRTRMQHVQRPTALNSQDLISSNIFCAETVRLSNQEPVHADLAVIHQTWYIYQNIYIYILANLPRQLFLEGCCMHKSFTSHVLCFIYLFLCIHGPKTASTTQSMAPGYFKSSTTAVSGDCDAV